MASDWSPVAMSQHHFRIWVLTFLEAIANSFGFASATADTVGSSFKTVAPSVTDSILVPAVAGKIVKIRSVFALEGNANTPITFNSKGAGAGTAKSPTFTNIASSGEVLTFNPDGWIRSNVGEGISLTTGAGSDTSLLYTWKYE